MRRETAQLARCNHRANWDLRQLETLLKKKKTKSWPGFLFCTLLLFVSFFSWCGLVDSNVVRAAAGLSTLSAADADAEFESQNQQQKHVLFILP